MDARETVIAQYKLTHNILQQVMADITPENLHAKLDGSTIDSVASTFAHLVFSQDTIVNSMALGAPTVLESGGWADKVGVVAPGGRQNHEWAGAVKLDLAKFMPYAQAVFANTESVIANTPEDQLATARQGPLGPSTVWGAITGLGLYHTVEHSGEISALLGVQGCKGLPF